MKLLHYTYRQLSILLVVLMAVWGVFFYYTVVDEVMDETDDTLENYSHILINSALHDPSVLDTSGALMSAYSFRPISEAEGAHYKTVFYDSTVYIEIEDEYEPVRVMRTAFKISSGQYYELTLMISVLEREDMMETVFWYLIILFLLFLIATSVGIRLILSRVFSPLHRLLQWLHQLEFGKEVPPLQNDTRIREFRQLNEAAVAMGQRAFKAYQEQKQFIENASHELQTPLAIARGKVELLAESDGMTEEQLKELDSIYSTLGRAVKLNKSLLLLSRIENGQYHHTAEVSVNELLKQLLPDLMDIYEEKKLRVEQQEQPAPFVICCHPSLAQILFTNLLKNALQHTPAHGSLQIILTSDAFEIRNTGRAPLDSSRLFQRFYHSLEGDKDSNGLGLSIVQSIAHSAGLQLTYQWEAGMHSFRLQKCAQSLSSLKK